MFLSQTSFATEFVTNGSFEQLTGVHSPVGGVVYPGFYSLNTSDGPSPLVDWTFSGYSGANFVSAPGYADDLANFVPGSLFGPQSGNNNGLTTSPDSGNFVVLDAYKPSASAQFLLSQTITGLTVGNSYDLSFYFASAEGTDVYKALPTTESVQVSFGNDVVSTETRSTPAKGFTAWALESFDFTASASTQILSFMAEGGPAGTPPQILLDGVSLTDVPVTPAVPEPSTWAMLAAGVAALGFVTRRSRRAQS